MSRSEMSSHAGARDERALLSKRAIPHMILGSGSRPIRPNCANTGDPSESATSRFAVTGNAIVTGGTGTLGLQVCEGLLEHGLSNLVIFDIDVRQSDKQLSELRHRFSPSRIEALQVDITDETAVLEAVDNACEIVGPVHHLLCFSGIVACVHAIDMTAAQWRRVIDVNTSGTFFCAQAVARKMIEQQSGGTITFTASISAHRVNYPQPQAAYNVSKAALLTLKNCLAAEWARYGIRTNTISPGYMDTILNEGDVISQARDVWASRNPLGRMGAPSELTGVAVLLSSSAGSYINGADIVIDGGGMVF